MTIPNFDLTTIGGVLLALDYMRETTEKDSIDNKLVANINNAIMNLRFDEMTNTEKRKLKNAMDSIDSGQYYVDGTRFPGAFLDKDRLKLNVFSSNQAPEEIVLKQEGAVRMGWLIGEPDYEIKIKETVKIKNEELKPGEYITMRSFGNTSLLFGKAFGDFNEGTIVGGTGAKYKIKPNNTQAQIFLEKNEVSNKDLTFNTAKVKLIDNSGVPIVTYVRRNYMPDVDLVNGGESVFEFISTQYVAFAIFSKDGFKFPEGKVIKYQLFKNGVPGQKNSIGVGGMVVPPWYTADMWGIYIEQSDEFVEVEIHISLEDDDSTGGD